MLVLHSPDALPVSALSLESNWADSSSAERDVQNQNQVNGAALQLSDFES